MILIVAALLAAVPQNLPDLHKNIIRAVDARDYSAAVTALQNLEASDPKTFFAGEYDYLLARVAESTGQLGLAMANYQSVAGRDSVLSAYALRHMSQIARSTGNLTLERICLQRILLFSPESLLVPAVHQRLARNSFESGNYGETVRILTSGFDVKASSNSPRREDQALLAEAYLRYGKPDAARDIFASLLEKTPNPAQPDDFAQTAAKGLDILDGGTEARAPDLTEGEHLRRANIYQFNRDFPDAKLHFEAIIARFPNGANVADAAFQTGRGYAQQGDHVEALKWFERVLEQYPDSITAKDALLQAASAYARVGKHKEAIKRYQKFIEKYPADEKLERAYLNTVDIYRDQGEDQEALKWCAKTREVFKGRLPEAVALFAQARIHFVANDWPNALNDLEQLRSFSDLGGVTPGGTNTAEITFLKGFVLEQMRQYAEAIDIYLSIPDGRAEYYGWRATERLQKLGQDEAASSFISQKVGLLSAGLKAKEADARRRNAQSLLRLTALPDLRDKASAVLRAAVKTLPGYSGIPPLKTAATATPSQNTVAGKLLSLGLMDEAAPEIEAASPNVVKTLDDAAFSLAISYKRGDRGDRGLAFIEPVWKKVPTDYPIELIPRDQLELLYPAVYVDTLARTARKDGVDPRLMLAIMRQESRFQPDAKSNAAARGLMQFISTTSTKIAGELGRGNFKQDDLYYPPTAILFGSRYLSDLFKLFPGQPDAVAASYNGGEDNMKRWLSRSRSSLPERFVPEIMFSQSKYYVTRVMANYRMYQLIYDEQLRPR